MSYLATYHSLGQAIFGNTEHQHAAWFRLHFKDFDIEALASQFTGNSKACRATTDNGHTATGLWQQFGVCKVHIAVEISNKALEFADTNRWFTLLVHDAVTLALTLVCTHTATYGRQIASAIDNSHSIAQITQ